MEQSKKIYELLNTRQMYIMSHLTAFLDKEENRQLMAAIDGVLYKALIKRNRQAEEAMAEFERI